MSEAEDLVYIAQCYSKDMRGEDVSASLGKSPAWLSLLLKREAPELRGKNTVRRKNAAIDWLERKDQNEKARVALRQEIKAMNVDDALIEMEGMNLNIARCLGMNDICSVEDLASLSCDEITGYREVSETGEIFHEIGIAEELGLSSAIAGNLIMRARYLEGWVEEPEVKRKAELMRTTCASWTKTGEVCGAAVPQGRRQCKACWIRTIPKSYAAMMTTAEYKHYLGKFKE